MFRIINRKSCFFRKIISFLIVCTFSFSLITPTNISAQTVLNLPIPGVMIPLSSSFVPTMIKGVKIFPNDPLRFDFIVDPGESGLSGESLKNESSKLIKYFLASITVPEDDMWVNLSPYEKDRIIPSGFGKTEMGRDLLAQDYILKQITASLMFPEEEVGKKFWDNIRKKANALYGTSEIPLNTFNKVWIIPERATVYEKGDTVFVADSYLKVMLEEDYLALEHNSLNSGKGVIELESMDSEKISEVSSSIIREIIIPELEKEVNAGKNFANLRQIYNSVILATWFKRNFKESFLGDAYVDQNKVEGINVADNSINEQIYNQYLESFKIGVYNFIKEEYDTKSQEIIPRKYFSGGAFVGPNKVFRKQDSLLGIEVSDDSVMAGVKLVGSPDNAMLSDEVLFEKREDGIALITINRPKSLNSLSKSVQAQMLFLFAKLQEDDDIHTVVLNVNGGFFSAGADLSERKGMSDVQILREVEGINAVIDAFEDLGRTKETVAVMQTAFGVGVELALAAKKRIMLDRVPKRDGGTRDTFLMLSEVTLGIIPGAGGTQRLPRLVGEHMAKKMTLSARQVKADVAKKIGLVDEVISSPEEMEAAVKRVVAIGERKPVVDEVFEVSDKGKKYSLQVDKKEDGTAWLTVGHFNTERKKTNTQIVEELELDSEVRAIVFIGLKNDFFRAADILGRVKNSVKPTVAVMRGSMDAKGFPLLRAFDFHVGVKGNDYNDEMSVEEALSRGLVEGTVDNVDQLSKAVKDFVASLTNKVAPISYALGKLAIVDGMKVALKTGLSVVQVNAYDLTVSTRERNESLVKVAKKEPRVFTWDSEAMNRMTAYARLYRQRALAFQYGVDLVEQRARLQGITVVLNEVTNRDGVQGEKRAHEDLYSAQVKLGVNQNLAAAGYVRQELGAFPSEKLLERGFLPGVRNSPQVASLAQQNEDLGNTQLGYLVLRPDGDETAIEKNPDLTEVSYNIALSLGYSVKNLNVKTGVAEVDEQGKDAIYAHLLKTLDEDGIYDLVMKMFRRKYVDSIRRVIKHGLTRESGKPIRVRVYPSNAFGYSSVKNGKRVVEDVDPDRFVRLIDEVSETVARLVDEVATEVGAEDKKDLVEVEIAISDTTGEVTDPDREDSLKRAEKVFERIIENEAEKKNGNRFALHLQNRGLGHLVILKYAAMFSKFDGDVVVDVSLGNTGGSPFSAHAPGNLESEGTILGLLSHGVKFRGNTSLSGTLQASRDLEIKLDDNFVRRGAIGLHHVPDQEVERVLDIWKFRNGIEEDGDFVFVGGRVGDAKKVKGLYISPGKVEGEADRAMMVGVVDPKNPLGGIDLNSNNIKLQIQGRGTKYNSNIIPSSLDSVSVNGFVPVIFQMTPITNIPAMLLGETNSLSKDQEQISRLY